MSRPVVAVAGGAGFVGGAVVRHLAGADYRLRASTRGRGPRWHVEDLDCQWHTMELNSRATIRPFVRGASAVIHCAGYYPRRALRVEEAKRRGVQELRNLVDICADEGVRRLVYVSSISTMMGQDSGDEPIDETMRYVPGSIPNAYFEAKAAMEAELYRYIGGGLDIVVVTPTTVFGPGDFKPSTGRLIQAVAEGHLVAVPRDVMMNVVDVRDVARGVAGALVRGRRGRRYILGGTNIDIADLVGRIAAATGQGPPKRQFLASRMQSMARAGECLVEALGWSSAPPVLVPVELAVYGKRVSHERAGGELNFEPRALSTTIDDCIQWLSRVGYLSWTQRSAVTQ